MNRHWFGWKKQRLYFVKTSPVTVLSFVCRTFSSPTKEHRGRQSCVWWINFKRQESLEEIKDKSEGKFKQGNSKQRRCTFIYLFILINSLLTFTVASAPLFILCSWTLGWPYILIFFCLVFLPCRVWFQSGITFLAVKPSNLVAWEIKQEMAPGSSYLAVICQRKSSSTAER